MQDPIKAERKRNREKYLRYLAIAKGRADIPAEVIRPYIELAIRRLNDEGGQGGLEKLALASGVGERRIYEIREDDKRGMALDFVDRLSSVLDFTLHEIQERTEEWALLTGARWPHDYLPKQRGYRERLPNATIRNFLREMEKVL